MGLAHLTCLTRLSAAAMSPPLDNKQMHTLTHLRSLQHLVRHTAHNRLVHQRYFALHAYT